MQYQFAKPIADRLCNKLLPFCTRLHIAGSIRRQQAEVGDIEIVCRPKKETVDTLFATEETSKRLRAFVAVVEKMGKIVTGDPERGRWIKIELPEDVQLDLFIPTESDYFRILAIRTGSRDYSHHVLAAAWTRLGWCGTKDGLRLRTQCVESAPANGSNTGKTTWKCTVASPALPPVWESEEEFFAWLKVEYVTPRFREWHFYNPKNLTK